MSASAGHAAVRTAAQRLGAAVVVSAVRRRDEPVLGGRHGAGRRAVARTGSTRRTGSRAAGFAAAIAAGATSSIWQNATETEVYAASLGLAMAALVAADIAGRDGDRRWLLLTAYFVALIAPLHLSAMVAGPAIVLLAADRGDGRIDWSAAFSLSGMALIVVGVGRLSPWMIGVGAVVLWGAPPLRDVATRNSVRRERATLLGAATLAVGLLLFMLVRARHDPAINQANPSTFDGLFYAIGRKQYDLPGFWPRQAPVWMQVANWFEYADWQFALSLAPTVIPTPARIAATGVFAILGFVGASWHRRRDVRTWRALVVLLLVRHGRRDRVSQPQGGYVVRLAIRARRGVSRGARPRLLLRPGVLGLGTLGRDERHRASPSVSGGRRGSVSPSPRCPSR